MRPRCFLTSRLCCSRHVTEHSLFVDVLRPVCVAPRVFPGVPLDSRSPFSPGVDGLGLGRARRLARPSSRGPTTRPRRLGLCPVICFSDSAGGTGSKAIEGTSAAVSLSLLRRPRPGHTWLKTRSTKRSSGADGAVPRAEGAQLWPGSCLRTPSARSTVTDHDAGRIRPSRPLMALGRSFLTLFRVELSFCPETQHGSSGRRLADA